MGGGTITPPPPQLSGNAAKANSKTIEIGDWLRKIQCALERTFFVIDLFLQLKDRVKHGFRPRRASPNVYVDGNQPGAARHGRGGGGNPAPNRACRHRNK